MRSRIPSLDGLRGIAILLVVICHLSFGITALPNHLNAFLSSLGGLGVRIFFVLSGFLITTILIKEQQRGGIRLGRFYLKRTLRIFPAYYFMIFCVAVLWAIGSGLVESTKSDLIHALTYTINYHASGWTLGHAWSLSVEEQFYLLWPACLLFLNRRTAVKVAILVVILCPLVRYVYWVSTADVWTLYRFESVADSLAVGCLLALRPLRRFPGIAVAIIVGSILCLNYLSMTRFVGFYLLLGITFCNFGIAVCIQWATTNQAGRVSELLNSRALSYLGVISYSVYLWQQVFLNPAGGKLSFKFPINLLLIAAVSLFSFYTIEQPALRFRQRLLKRRAPLIDQRSVITKVAP
ncbi:MAG TPA: acyltransferase [Blastocatellia bacterium]|nr:acyltransferase [Blastocatellia bacterium]